MTSSAAPAPDKTAAHTPKSSGRSRLLRLLPLVLLVVVALGAWWAGLPQQISLSRLAARHAEMQAAVAAHPVAAVAAYVAGFAILTAACLPVALVMTLLSGLLFGPVIGGAATVTGAVVGSLLTYGAARTAFGPWLRQRAKKSPRLRKVMDGFGDNAFGYVLTLRFIPVAPFAGVNIAAGLAGAPLRPFLLATLLAGSVTSFIYAGLGAGLGQSLGDAHSVKAALSRPMVVWPVIGLAVLAFLPTALKLYRNKFTRPARP
jgi:uncharacterized membrane protein YdjX (TVP38/TMEM64 family)